MHINRHVCPECPQLGNELDLIETRFQNGLCFIELECRHCDRLWTAEVSMPVEDDFHEAQDGPGPSWRLVNIAPRLMMIGNAPDQAAL